MNTKLALFLIAGLSAFINAEAQSATVYAKIISQQPVYQNIPTTQISCQNTTRTYVTPNAGNTVAGAIVGGAIGNAISNRHNRGIGTALGAMIGADVGSNVNPIYSSVPTQTCQNYTTYTQTQVGCNVQYELNGAVYNTQLKTCSNSDYIRVQQPTYYTEPQQPIFVQPPPTIIYESQFDDDDGWREHHHRRHHW